MKKLIITIITLSFTLVVVSACGTIEGAGKDLQRAGQVVEQKARR